MDINQLILGASSRIKPFIRKTTLSYSETFSKLVDGEVYFKLENQQFTGSFKARGALNKILTLNESGKSISSVISASTGNHGAAVAYAARQANIECNIYIPKGSSKAKLSNMKNYGATINTFGSDCVVAEKKAREVSEKNQVPYVSPYNDFHVVAGQGTMGLEIKSQTNELDVIIISIGGGGMMAGTASFLKSVWPNIKVIGCSPSNSAIMIHSMEAGKILELESLPTLSDGTAGGMEKESITFPLCCKLVDETILISEKEIKDAMVFYIENEHQLLEGAAGTAVAALIKIKDKLKGKKIGVVICGGNISIDTLKQVIS
jgi:threonine dehydratase